MHHDHTFVYADEVKSTNAQFDKAWHAKKEEEDPFAEHKGKESLVSKVFVLLRSTSIRTQTLWNARETSAKVG